MADTQLHLRWHSHGLTFIGMLHDLHMGRAYTDVSLVCDGGVVRAHRAVLSLSSPYLATVLGTCMENDEAPLLLPEVPVQDIRYLISFIYRGQVDVPQTHIASFLNTGKHLQVLGLEQGDQLVDSPCKSEGSSSPASDAEEDSNLVRDLLGNNNKGEKKEKTNGEGKVMVVDPRTLKPEVTKEAPNLLRVEDIKEDLKDDIKEEDIKEEATLDDGRIDLNYYLQQAIQSASMPCPLCKKEFKSQSGLRDHIRLHTGERPFVCDFCHMNFARASHLKRHRRMHTGEKPFECSVCGKDFSRGDKLKDHLRRHEAEDKLHQIRKQILNLEEVPAENDTTQAGVPSIFSSACSTTSSTPFGTTFATSFAPISSLATGGGSTSQILLSKLTGGGQMDTLPPPSKRHCSTPSSKLPLGAVTQFSQTITPVPSLLMPQSENAVPQVLGVTSIGECILRPIN